MTEKLKTYHIKLKHIEDIIPWGQHITAPSEEEALRLFFEEYVHVVGVIDPYERMVHSRKRESRIKGRNFYNESKDEGRKFMSQWVEGLEVTYKGKHGYIKFIDELYLTICVHPI